MVIDFVVRSKGCVRHKAKGKSFSTWSVILQDVPSEKAKKVGRNSGASDDSVKRFAVAGRGKRLDNAPQSSKPRPSYCKASFPEGAEVVQIDGKRLRLTKVHVRKWPHARNHGKLRQSRKWTSENPQNDAAEKTSAIREPMVYCANHSRRIQDDRVESVVLFEHFFSVARDASKIAVRFF